MRNKKLYNIALAATMTTAAVVAIAPAQADAAKSFSDLTPANVHYDNVMNLVERGVITGYPDGTFKPNQSISRAHAAKIIAKALGLDTKNVKNPNFKDIPTNYAYYGEIAALANAGIINGYPDGTFKPNATLTRGQTAKIIARAFELTGNANNLPFKDIANSEYKEYIAALYANKVTTGTTPTTYSPVNPVTRGQLASFVVRAEEAKGTVVAVLPQIGQFNGISDSKIEFTLDSNKTFSQVITLLDNTSNIQLESELKAFINNYSSEIGATFDGIDSITVKRGSEEIAKYIKNDNSNSISTLIEAVIDHVKDRVDYWNLESKKVSEYAATLALGLTVEIKFSNNSIPSKTFNIHLQ